MSQAETEKRYRIGFVCVENAGRSQIATAVAKTQIQIRNRSDINIISGGTDPATEIYPNVVQVMREKGYDLSTQVPRKISSEEIRECDIVALMGCSLSIDDLPAGIIVRYWRFIDPADADIESVMAISTEIERQVIELLDELPDETYKQTQLSSVQ